MIKFLLSFLTGGGLKSILSTAEKWVESQTEKDKLRADIIREHMRTRAGWMKAGGFWTLLLFAVPTAFHYGSVVVYSVFWCSDCAYPKDWTIAALPGQMATWEGWVLLACIGGLSLFAWRK